MNINIHEAGWAPEERTPEIERAPFAGPVFVFEFQEDRSDRAYRYGALW